LDAKAARHDGRKLETDLANEEENQDLLTTQFGSTEFGHSLHQGFL
jgi:hypothetical protein